MCSQKIGPIIVGQDLSWRQVAPFDFRTTVNCSPSRRVEPKRGEGQEKSEGEPGSVKENELV